MHNFTEEQTPAHIVKVFPKASDVFKTYGINFCCQGDRVLKDTFDEKELEGPSILTELNNAYSIWKDKGNEAIDWDEVSLSFVIDYIKENYHPFLDEELPALESFVSRINHVHGYESPHLQELSTLYHEFLSEAEATIIQAASELYPKIELSDEIEHTNVGEEINLLRTHHENMIDLFKKMREITDDFTPPFDACGSYRITYARLIDLEKVMMDYIHIENNILFARLENKM